MFSAFPIDESFFTDHLRVVLGIALVFFLVQIALTIAVCRRARSRQKLLAQLCRNFDQGGHGRAARRPQRRHFAWIDWVASNFPAGSHVSPAKFSRDDVLQELDTRLANGSAYLLLQRMGVMAPLLGVVLTVVGFYWLQVEEFEEQSLKSILMVVTPLLSGVGAGAVLALVNQALLHVAGRRLEALRTAARDWFDTVIWNNIEPAPQSATAETLRGMRQFAASVTSAAEKYAAGTRQFDESAATIRAAASQIHDVVQTFTAEMKDIPEALSAVRQTTAAAANAFEELLLVGSRAVANLDVSVAAFRTALDRDFTPAAKLHLQSSKILAESAQQIGDTTTALKTGSDELSRTAQSNAAAFQMLDESFRQHVLPGNHRFHEAVDDLTAQVASLSSLVRAASTGVEGMAREFSHAADGLSRSAASFTDAVDNRLEPAVTHHARQVESVERSIERLREMADSMSGASAAVIALLGEASQLVHDARNATSVFSHAAAKPKASSPPAELGDAISSIAEQQVRYRAELDGDGDADIGELHDGFPASLVRKPR